MHLKINIIQAYRVVADQRDIRPHIQNIHVVSQNRYRCILPMFQFLAALQRNATVGALHLGSRCRDALSTNVTQSLLACIVCRPPRGVYIITVLSSSQCHRYMYDFEVWGSQYSGSLQSGLSVKMMRMAGLQKSIAFFRQFLKLRKGISSISPHVNFADLSKAPSTAADVVVSGLGLHAQAPVPARWHG